jgi:hypothetical protein
MIEERGMIAFNNISSSITPENKNIINESLKKSA